MSEFFSSILQSIISGAIIAALVYFGLKFYFSSYFSEKGKNLATKEDIGKITSIIESIKQENAKELEGIKADLSVKLKTHGFRYEKEYELLVEMTKELIFLREAINVFKKGLLTQANIFASNSRYRILHQFKPPSTSYVRHPPSHPFPADLEKEMIEMHDKSLQLFAFASSYQPFYKREIFILIESLHLSINSWQTNIKNIFTGSSCDFEQKLKQYRTAEQINLIDQIIVEIRNRVIEWEGLK